MFSMRQLFVLSALGMLFGSLPCLPQSPASKTSVAPAVPPSTQPSRYANEPGVVEALDTEYRFAADGTGSKQVTMAIRLQTEAAVKQFSVLTVPFAGNTQHVVFDYVRVRHPDGSVVATPVADVQEMPEQVTIQAPFYSDLKDVQLPVRGLTVGDTLEYRAHVAQTKPEAPGQFWGEHRLIEGMVVLSETVELHVPKSKYVQVWSPTLKPTVAEDGDERVYSWKSSSTDPTVGPEAEAKKEADKKKTLTEAEQLDRTKGKFPTIAWTTFKNWAELGQWYRSLAAPRAVADDDIKAKVAELTAGKTTDDEKIRALYSYVATQIRYIGVAFGIGRFQPHMAGDVLSNQYGDCKDKHTLLAAMLSAAGIQADAALIGANVRFNPDVPSPTAFNHMITMIPLSTGPVWLDATEEGAPYRAMISILRDKDALVIPATGDAQIEKTPAALPFKSFENLDAKGSLDENGTATYHIVLTARGDDEIIMRALLRQISPGQYDEFIQKFSQGLGFAGTANHADISKPDATVNPLDIAFDYRRDKTGDWTHYRILPQFPPVYLPVVDDNNPPQVPIDLGAIHTEDATTALKLPDGWGATLPDAVHVHTPFATFDKTYRIEKGTLYADRRIAVLQDKVPAAQWKAYQKFVEDAGFKDGENYIQLISSVKKAGVAGPPLPSANNEQAADLIQEAVKTAQSWDLDGATKLLDKAKKLNDKQERLWAAYGYIAALRGTNLEAVADYKKEMAAHPDEQPTYLMLAHAQMLTGQRNDAEQTLKSGLKQGPNLEMALTLAPLLYQDGTYAEVVKMLAPVAAKHPENDRLQLTLGRAQMKSGNTEEGSKTLVALLKSTGDSGVLNDAAYELADADTELALAETSTLKALDMMTKESATLTLDTNPAMAKSKAQMLAATWDTMGWIYFKEHKLDEAENYLHAAWLSETTAAGGLHLGQVEEAQGKLNEALKTYDLALTEIRTTFIPSSATTTTIRFRPATDPVAQELHRRVDALKRKGARDRTSGAALTEVQNLRKLRIGPAEGRSGTADYKVLMVGGNVEAVKGPADNAVHNADAMVKKVVLPNWWPKGSQAKMVREGILNCHSGVCEFVMVPLQ